MAGGDSEADRIADTIEGQRPPDMGEVIGMPGSRNGSARGQSQDERVEAFENPAAPKQESAPAVPDAEDTLRAAGFKLREVDPDVEENDGWSDKPSVKTQYQDPRFISTVAEGPEKVDQFVLSNNTHKDALNALKKKAAKVGAPQVVILIEEKEFSQTAGSFVVFVVYKEIFYRSLIEIK